MSIAVGVERNGRAAIATDRILCNRRTWYAQAGPEDGKLWTAPDKSILVAFTGDLGVVQGWSDFAEENEVKMDTPNQTHPCLLYTSPSPRD